ncbi:ATP-dependent DNA helicase [Methanothermobacter tenebrarum]|uniref:DNA 3'-5' helicase n=1 Tax=Methanothermobacter tenebrarum TaxID=680118 RepID=A0A328PA22_9EURY|nr:ATP-dependent DNA helicase [Methanothermobacter tenebrarum]NPV64728.1 ATP-dependent helicase [Methanobacteriaceae archaeon]RAO79059.1 ATP-dependent helicase [Methanothermobacter tenebrarum]
MTRSLCDAQEECTETQKEAVKYDEGPLLIVAGPGTGKTRVIIEKVAYLIKKENVDPGSILVITFTEKAAEELKNRLRKCVGLDVERMQVSTIHSFCNRILREYSEYHDLGAGFDILDNDDQLIFIRSHFYKLGLNKYIRMGEAPDVITFFNECSENCIDPEELKEALKREHPDNGRYHGFCDCYAKYLDLLKKEGKIDFPGLQRNAVELLESNEKVKEDLRTRFKYILIDEYQDTNPIQERLFELLASGNICVVGDEDQSIYGFRGSTVENIRSFEDKFNAHTIFLDENFRSRAGIIKIADEFMNKSRYYKKRIKAKRNGGYDVILLESRDAHDEARRIVRLLKNLKRDGIIPDYGHVALLFKSVRYHAGKIIGELEKEGVPYTIRGDGSFLDRDEIKSILYFLGYVNPPRYKNFRRWDWWNISMFDGEFLGLSRETKNALKGFGKTFKLSSLLDEESFKEAGIKEPADIKKLLGLNRLKEKIKKEPMSILEIFYKLLDITGYLGRLIEDDSYESRVKLLNLAKLSSIIKKYERTHARPSVQDFMWYLYLLPKHMQYDGETLDTPDSVKIMTIHQAKGLEFPVVIICSVVNGRFPRQGADNRSFVPIPEHLKLSQGDVGDEERRLFYVAMTRAQDILIISTAQRIRTRKVGYSPFIKELVRECELEWGCKRVEKCVERSLREDNIMTVNFSSLHTYEECPFRYMMIYHYGFIYPETRMQVYGKILHNCLEMLHKKMKKGEKVDIREIVETCWRSDKFKEKLEKQLKNYYNKNKDYIKRVIAVEEPFSIPKDDIIIRGRTDLIIENKDGEIELVDFKAREKAGIEYMGVDFQLRTYEYALSDKYKFDKLTAYTIKDNERTSFKPDPEHRIKNKIENIVDSIKNEKFKPKENYFCKFCIFQSLCGIQNEGLK